MEHAQLVESWHAIPDHELAEMRGGLDLGSLIANFAIERLVRINGEVVARTQLVLSELGNLSNGGLPSVELAGNIASLIQVGENNSIMPAAGTAQAASQPAGDSLGAQAAAAAAAQAAAQQAASSASAPAAGGGSGAASQGGGAASQGGAGSVASVNYASGSGGLFGPGLAMAIAAANGELPGQAESNAANAAANASSNAAASGSSNPAGSGSTNAPVNAASNASTIPGGVRAGASGLAGASASGSSPTSAAAAPGAAAPAAGSAPAAATGTPGPAATAAQPSGVQALGTITVPVGNTGRTIVINNLPNAAALTTAIQNSVESVRIDTETSISATMSSLAALRSSNFAAMLQQQAIDSVRR
ncbi:MAG: hypothetical protein GX644_03265 [Limnobacter sp.]|nr:hypothetical protein [Limnobacter sp.]